MQNKALLQGLNDAQQKAVLHGEGPALVAAGPGSGKTTVITRRLLYLIQERKVPPKNILVITFTKEAAKSMQERFISQLREFNIYQSTANGFVSFGTFHSYFYQIIRSVKKYSNYRLITQQEKYRILKPILKEYTEEEVTEASMNKLLSQISYYKNTGVFLPEWQEKTDIRSEKKVATAEGEPLIEKEVWLRQFQCYEQKKETYQRMDFDDMLYLCKRALREDEELLAFWQKRFTYMLIDEYQDINPIQYELVRMLTLPPENLFVVGDDDQAIYGFRGADSKIFQRFLQDYPKAVQISLEINYRCGGKLVEASRSLIERNKVRVAKELTAWKENASKGKIRVVGAVNTKESYGKVISALKELEEKALGEAVILFRTNSAMQMMATELIGNQIPFILREKCESIYEHFLVKDIMDYMLAAEGSRERSLFLRIFHKQRTYLPREALRAEYVDLKQVKIFYQNGFYESRQAVEAIEVLERNLLRLKNMRPRLAISYILHAMDYEGYLRRKVGDTKAVWEEWKALLEWLQEDAADFANFAQWKVHQELYGEALLQKQITGQEEKKGIHLLTLHAAKGLEFDRVYMMNLNEGTLPKYRHSEILSTEKLEEERRLCYVGMTRAKEVLELHYVTGTKENPKLRSRFLEEIAKTIE